MAIIIGNTTVNTSIAGSNVTVNVPQGYAEYNATRNSIMPTLRLDFVNSNVLDPRITFTRASSATYFNSAGALTTAANNIPRFDYNPSTLVCNGLLIEQSSVNILLNSATLSTQSVTTTATTYTLSFYGTGTVTLSGTYAGSLVGSGAFPTRSTLSFTATAGTLTLTVTGTVSYAQLEALSFPTSYIATAGASATRIADVVTMTGTNFSSWYNSSYGTYAINATFRNISNPSTTVLYGTSDASGFTNTFYTVMNASGAIVYVNGFGVLTASANVPFKLASNYVYGAPGTTSSSANGGAVSPVNQSWTSPHPPTKLAIGSSPWANDSNMTGWIQRFAYYPVAVSNNELISLTS